MPATTPRSCVMSSSAMPVSFCNWRNSSSICAWIVTHDLGVVAGMADQVAVMYAGHIVEQASRAAVFAHPRHPYSQKLFASLPERGKRGRKLAVIAGSVPSLAKPFRACRFVERCPHAWETCREVAPRFLETEPGTAVRCH